MQNAFVRNVGVLTGGTFFAQALMAAALPILTRLYTPQDFSVLAIYIAVLSIIIGVANLGLNYAIPDMLDGRRRRKSDGRRNDRFD